MADEIRPEVIKKTQSSLGRYIKKPPLTEKLLRKPPFRFLHDIISAIIKETGFLDNLFTDEELSPDIRDKEAKLAYLTKLINVVELITGSELKVRPSKIIAGQEPTKTNELLQAIAKALDKNVNSTEAVKHYKENLGKDGRRTSPSKSSKNESSKTSTSKRNVHSREASQQPEKAVESTKIPPQSGRSSKKQPEADDINRKKDASNRKLQQTKKTKTTNEINVQSKSSANSSTRTKSRGHKASDESPKASTAAPKDEIQLESADTLNQEPSIVEEKEQTIAETIQKVDSLGDGLSKPMKNNEAPQIEAESGVTEGPKVVVTKDELQESVTEKTEQSVPDQTATNKERFLRPPSSRPSSARPAAPKLRWKPDFSAKRKEDALIENETIIVDNFDTQNDDDDTMVVLETEPTDYIAVKDTVENLNGESTQEHGHLVAQILETQRELSKVPATELISSNKIDTTIEQSSKKYTESIVKEVDKFRKTIQTLTRGTHPMGKLLDFLQEDVELMQKELSDWQNQFRVLHNQLQVEKAASETAGDPLQESFDAIQTGVTDQLDKIYQTKSSIIKNNYKIHQLLEGRAQKIM